MAGGEVMDQQLELVAIHIGDDAPVKIEPADRWREWMNSTDNRFANRCLPLLMANQAGWVLLNPKAFEARWEGGDRRGEMVVEYDEDVPGESRVAKSHFGYGILTFQFKCIFRTPPGYNVLARGPANSPKDGIGPLEGLIETDWAFVPFTMNWKFTRPGSVRFEVDEPFCQIVPQRRGELERFRPGMQTVEPDGDLEMRIGAWEAARVLILLGKRITKNAGDETWPRIWLNDYFKGRAPTGECGEDHQTQLRLGRFT